VLAMDGGIAISEDPNIRFNFRPNGADKLRDGAKIVIRSENSPAQTTNPAQAPATPEKSGGGKKRRSDGEQKQ